MSYDENQKSERIQKVRGGLRYITGLWKKDNCLKSGRINRQGWANLQSFGEDTILILCENKRKRNRKPGAPNWKLYAARDFTSFSEIELKQYNEEKNGAE